MEVESVHSLLFPRKVNKNRTGLLQKLRENKSTKKMESQNEQPAFQWSLFLPQVWSLLGDLMPASASAWSSGHGHI